MTDSLAIARDLNLPPRLTLADALTAIDAALVMAGDPTDGAGRPMTREAWRDLLESGSVLSLCDDADGGVSWRYDHPVDAPWPVAIQMRMAGDRVEVRTCV